MATVRFNSNILEAARILKDARSDPSTAGDGTNRRYTSAILTAYQNKSVRALLKESYFSLGPDGFREVFPEYVATSGALTLVAGTVALPVDAWYVTDVNKSDYSVHFSPLAQDQVEIVRGGNSGLIVPSQTEPVFWQESDKLYVLPVATVGSWDIIVRYIKTHQDLVVSTATGNGDYDTGGFGTYTAATRTLIAGWTVGLASPADVNKPVMWLDGANKVWYARIERIVNTTTAIVYGDALPPADGPVQIALLSDVEPDAADLLINQNWDPEIVGRMVEYGIADAQRGIV